MKAPMKRMSMIAKGKRCRGAVFHNKKEKTATGLRKADLARNKRKRIVSKRASAAGAQVYFEMFHSYCPGCFFLLFAK